MSINNMSDIDGFISAPIKLAAIINNNRRKRERSAVDRIKPSQAIRSSKKCLEKKDILLSPQIILCSAACTINLLLLLLLLITPSFNSANLISSGNQANQDVLLRHKTHYMNINPSTQFQYKEGRQLNVQGGKQRDSDQERSLGGSVQEIQNQNKEQQVEQQQHFSSHIYKRSSALLSSSIGSHYPPLVNSIQTPLMNPLSRRMMSEAAHSRWTAPQMLVNNEQQQQPASGEELSDLISLGSSHGNSAEPESSYSSAYPISSTTGQPAHSHLQLKRREHEEAELLRQKQHIQYHDQWPSMAGKCHKRTLNFCASVLPFNTTTFPNIIGDTNRFEVKRSLPFFGFLAKSSCNKRLDELLCLLLEPPCSVQTGVAIPPCKKFCRLALEGCNEYIPATLAMSSVFDCRQYPDSSEPSVCINLAQGSKCAADEFKCPDKTCIPRNWLCDGVRDCIFAADEANCTAITGVGLQSSVCSTEEFKCDGKCVPKAWKCDGERDCLDGTDEESCDQRPRCGPDRFKCADGNGCLPKRWVCDGKAECRDGSDEINCEHQECSENDFKCDNGICIPKIWRCDRQSDCKDGSDERACVYPTSSTTPTPTTFMATESANYVNSSLSAATPKQAEELQQVANSQSINLSQPSSSSVIVEGPMNSVSYYAGAADSSQQQQQQQQQQTQQVARQQLESSLNEDISRIIQQQQEASLPASSQPPISVAVSSSSGADIATSESLQHSASTIPVTDVNPSIRQAAGNSQKELKKFDYDIIQSSSSPNLIHSNDLSSEVIANQQQQQQQQPTQQVVQKSMQQIQTQIDFVPQQQQQASSLRQVTPASHLLVGHAEQLISQQQQKPVQVFARQQHIRERPFGQVIKVSTSGNQKVGEQGAVVVERVPIYRSLFKTLKGGQGRLLAAAAAQSSEAGSSQGYHRYSMSRRRRDRHQQPILSSTTSTTIGTSQDVDSSRMNPTQQQQQQPQSQQIWTSVAPFIVPSSSMGVETLSSPLPSPQQVNQTHNVALPSPHRNHHGVASYLQLLNSRYNLRLNRALVSPLPSVVA